MKLGLSARLTTGYLILVGSLIATAYVQQMPARLTEIAVLATLPWSLGHGLFLWSAMHGLEHELALYLLACLGLNGAILYVLERRCWNRRRSRGK